MRWIPWTLSDASANNDKKSGLMAKIEGKMLGRSKEAKVRPGMQKWCEMVVVGLFFIRQNIMYLERTAERIGG